MTDLPGVGNDGKRGWTIHNQDPAGEVQITVTDKDIIRAFTWMPGDPCASCGSTDTGWNAVDGGFCRTCGRSDADE